MKCQCLTTSGQPCKLEAEAGSRYCSRYHSKCENPIRATQRIGGGAVRNARATTNFDQRQCVIPGIWCGSGAMPQNTATKRYSKAGTPLECLQQGIGAGTHIERRKYLDDTSLQTIRYVSDVHEAALIRQGIRNTDELIMYCKAHNGNDISSLLRRVLSKKSQLDVRAYNSVLMFLYTHGVRTMPSCIYIE